MRIDAPLQVGPTGLATITGRELINETNVTSAVAEVDVVLGGNFPWYEIYLDGVIPATDASALVIRFSENGGATFFSGAADYQHANIRMDSQSGFTDELNLSNSFIALTAVTGGHGVESGTEDGGIWGRILLANANTAGVWTRLASTCYYINALGNSRIESINCSGSVTANGTGGDPVDAIRFLFDTGNIVEGNFRVYGVLL